MNSRLALRTAAAAVAGFVVFAAGCGPTNAQPPPAAPTFSSSGDVGFDAWRNDYAARAVREGRDPNVLKRLLDGITPESRVIDLDRRQPEFTAPVWDYINTRVSGHRIEAGRALKAEIAPLLAEVEARYGVDADIILGVWGLESNFGEASLPHDAPRALATLAYEGRRREAFERYLSALAEMVERGYAGPAELKSSWAGALGQPQFMPDAYLELAADWDGDGRRDIWTNRGDVAASIAHYLQSRGWQAGQAAFDEVRLPAGFDLSLADGQARPLADWEAREIVRIDARAWTAEERAMASQLYLPAGAQGPVLLLHPNFVVIRRYNASDRYAMSVALLARAYEGRGGLVKPWPTHLATLQRDEMLQLQLLLNSLGYNAGVSDGQFGSNTRRAVSGFQTAQGLAPDGYPTAEILRLARLRAGVDTPTQIRESDLPRARGLDRAGVRDLQRRLTEIGYATGEADGLIGERTRAAIRAFESDQDLAVTGRATTRVLAALRRAAR